MKCTLRKVEQGVVATIEERHKAHHPYYNSIKCKYFSHAYFTKNTDHAIIASTFGVGKEIYIEYFGWAGSDTMELDNFVKVWGIGGKEPIDYNKEYTYTETETQIIIKL